MKNNVFRKTFFILSFIILPLLIVIGAASWIVVTEYKTRPRYNPSSLYYIYLNGDNKTYTGSPLLPDSNDATVSIDYSDIKVQHRKDGETVDKLKDGAPTNAGTYYLYLESKSGDPEFEATEIKFTINTAEPSVTKWPSYKTMFYGNNFTVNEAGTANCGGTFTITGNPVATTTVDKTGHPIITYNVPIKFESNDSNYTNKTITGTSTVGIYAVADINNTYYGTIDEALAASTSGNTIYIMINDTGVTGDVRAKTIGITLPSATKEITLKGGVTLCVPYTMSKSGTTYSYNSTVTGYYTDYADSGKSKAKEQLVDSNNNPLEWGALNVYIKEWLEGTYLTTIGEVQYVVYPITNPNMYLDSTVANANYFYEYWDSSVSPAVLRRVGVAYTPVESEKYYPEVNSRDFADSGTNQLSKGKSTFLMNTIVLKESITLNIEASATLKITGILGQPTGQALQGHTSREYAELKIKPNAKINNYGTIICGGYIKEVDNNLNYKVYSTSENSTPYKGEIIVRNGGQIKMPFVFHDYRGGTSTTASYATSSSVDALTLLGQANKLTGNIMPFSRYNLPNIQTRITVNDGGYIYGYGDLYTGALSVSIISIDAQHNITTILFIGPSNSGALFTMYSGSKITLDTVMKTPGVTKIDHGTQKTYMTVSGTNGIALTYIDLALNVLGKDITVTSKNVYFAICDMWDIKLTGGTSDINYKFKLMPGAKITVSRGATLNINSSLAVYSGFVDNAYHTVNSDGSKVYFPAIQCYPTASVLGNESDASLIVNGTLNVKSDASLGGHVKTTGTGAIININADATLSTSCKEGAGGRSGLNFVFYPVTASPINERFRINKYSNGVVSSNSSNGTAGTYLSIQDSNNNYGWVQQKFAIIFNPNNANLVDYEIPSLTVPNVDSNNNVIGYPITDDIYPTIVKPNTLVHYSYRWSLSPNEFVDPAGQTVFETTTLYAIWTPISYTLSEVNYIHYDEEGKLVTQTVTNPSSNPVVGQTFNVLTNYALEKPTTEGLKFSGWYAGINSTTNELINPVSNFIGANYLSAEGTVLPVTLYGYWTYGAPLEIKYEFSGEVPTGISLNSTSVSLRKINDYSYPTDFDSYYSDYTKASYLLEWRTVKSDGTEEVLTIDALRTYLATLPEGTEVTIKGVWSKKAELQIIGYRDTSLIGDSTATKETLFNTSDLITYKDAINNIIYLPTTDNYQLTSSHNMGTTYSKNDAEYAFWKYTYNGSDVSSINIVNGNKYVVYSRYLKKISVSINVSGNLGTVPIIGGNYTIRGDITINYANQYISNSITNSILSVNGDNVIDETITVTLIEGTTYSFASVNKQGRTFATRTAVKFNPENGTLFDDVENKGVTIGVS